MVNKIVKGPGTGKTKELVEFAAANKATIVCKNVDKMREKIYAYGYTGIPVIDYSSYISRAFISRVLDSSSTLYCIDNVDEFCEFINVVAFTLTY